MTRRATFPSRHDSVSDGSPDTHLELPESGLSTRSKGYASSTAWLRHSLEAST